MRPAMIFLEMIPQHAPIELFDALAAPQWIELFWLKASHPLDLGSFGVDLVSFPTRFELGLWCVAKAIAGLRIRPFFRFVLSFLGTERGHSAKQNH